MPTRREYDGDPRSLGRRVNLWPWTILRLLALAYFVGVMVWLLFFWDRMPC